MASSASRRPAERGLTASRTAAAVLTSRFLFQVAMIVFSTVIYPGQCDGDLVDVYVTEGQNKMLECRFDPQFASRNTVYYWIRSNKEEQDNVAIADQSLDNHYRVELDTNEGKYRLFISNTSYANDNAKFQCKVKETGTGMGFHVQIFKLIVLINPGPPVIKSSLAIATEGQQFQLTCSSVGGSPDPDIKWYRDGETAPLESSLQPGGTKEKPSVSLLVFDPKKEDDGVKFSCVVNNKALEHNNLPKLQDSFRMEVNYIPRVSIQPKNTLKVEQDTTTSASCRVDSKPEPMSIKWTHNGRIVSNSANLNVKISSQEDAGGYTCSADNGLGIAGKAELMVDLLYGPRIQMESKREANENEDVVVRCNVSANPPAEIHWFKEGDASFITKGPILRLEKINSRSMGRYTCEATNELLTSSRMPARKTANATVSVWIKHRPGNTVIHPENAAGVEGKSLTLTCSAYPPGWPEPKYRWWKDVPNNSLPSGQNYTIHQARNSNEGRYFCQAYNDLGEGNAATLDLKIYEPPRLLTSLKSSMVKRTSDSGLALTCEARAKPHPSVRWLKNGQKLDQSGINEITTTEAKEGTNGAFLVKSVLKFTGPERPNFNQLTIDDGGVYTCEFDNKVVDPIGSNTTLKIEHGPILRRTERKVAFDTMTRAALECRMQAYPAPAFEWSFQNTVITSGSQQYKINQTDETNDVHLSTLTLQQVHVNDYGEYTCSASNSIDSAKTHIRLVPRGPPEAPTNLHAVNITDHSMKLQWNNGFNGGYDDTVYVLTYWSAGIPKSAKECYNSGCFVGGLEEMTEYYFCVQAQNLKGDSELSSELIVETKIGANNLPRPVHVYFNQDNSELYFEIAPTKLELFGKVEVWNGEWVEYASNVPISRKEVRLKLDLPPYSSNGIRVSLCLKNNTFLCGKAVDAAPGSPPSLITANTGISTLIITIAVACGVAILIILGCTFYCCRRRNSTYKEEKVKKDYEMEAANARPKAITAPYYPEGIVNKGVEGPLDHDDANKHPTYGTQIAPMNNQHAHDHSNAGHHISNGNMPPGYGYFDREFSNSNGGSVDSQDSLWMKNNGEANTERSYSYDPSLSNAYMYPEEYHHVNEDMMNQRNRENIYNSDPYGPVKAKKRNDHLNDVFHDVSGMPDPYMEEEEKLPHHSISFDESLESGYSTPNSRSRRVIREIIV